jgi:hypothetical protein
MKWYEHGGQVNRAKVPWVMEMEVAMRARRVMKGATVLVLCVMLASSIEGRTAIAFAVGARADSRTGKGGPELLMKVKVGRPVTLFLRDGRKLEGRFSGWSRDSGAASSVANSMPLREESVKLATRSGEVTIHAEEIARVSISVSRGKVTGLLVGAAVDALAISAFIYGMEHSVASAHGQ